MSRVFINLSNHASERWDSTQRLEGEKIGEIIDFPFPQVEPDADEQEITELAREVFRKVMELEPAAIMCQGEYTLTYQLVRMFSERGIPCFAACTRRDTVEQKEADGSITKVSSFRFVRFRQFV